ncbi:flagellar biosynthesis anti-sigma factor FlgM [Paracidovorax anthurii]|uniref:Negative regulator of flagellin synthesis n=1 Tax=Paracidovorax anthurii TaxID=78229 RepID=A0A328YSZ9_9BURK|nr:flagellar biosynthesis anti-sigma factor FlgM [Paracidovorax anthurii]RAR76840.1 FlgM family anti-sigma-28 factor [Paracidovorax anthurii]
MRISSPTALPEVVPAAPATPAAPAAAPTPASAPASAPGAESQTAILQPARAALSELPAVDQTRVAEIRDALARGELPFDPERLAALVVRYHGSGR